MMIPSSFSTSFFLGVNSKPFIHPIKLSPSMPYLSEVYQLPIYTPRSAFLHGLPAYMYNVFIDLVSLFDTIRKHMYTSTSLLISIAYIHFYTTTYALPVDLLYYLLSANTTEFSFLSPLFLSSWLENKTDSTYKPIILFLY